SISNLPFVIAGPEMPVRVAVEELRRHPNTRSISHDRPLDNRVDSELPRNLRERQAAGLELHHRLVRGNAQSLNPCEVCDQLIGHAVGEELLLAIAGEV